MALGGQAAAFAVYMEQFLARCRTAGFDADKLLREADARSKATPRLGIKDAMEQVWREATGHPEDWQPTTSADPATPISDPVQGQ